jgi:RNA polymerase II elongation factor ELL
MPSLVIPESGMSLGSSLETASKPGSAVLEVFGLTLSDSLIEEMIKCVQNDKPIQLSLGEQPVSFQTIVATSTGDFGVAIQLLSF